MEPFREPTDADLVELLIDHYRAGDDCHDCGGAWPCLTVTLATALQAERAFRNGVERQVDRTFATWPASGDNSHDHPWMSQMLKALEQRVQSLELMGRARHQCTETTIHDGTVVRCEKGPGHWNLERYDPHMANLANGHTLLWPG